jgi:hypothetical protein
MNASLHFRIFASSESALRKGSFYKVNYYPACTRGVARFINGQYIDLGCTRVHRGLRRQVQRASGEWEH